MASNLLANAAFYTSAPLETGERDRLILENLPHVRWVAMRIHEKIGGAVSLEDLVSSGVIGLINAVDSYDPKFNVKLKTYAEHRIRGSILDSIRGLDGIPVHKRKRL
jgi:RNA polymerase sigma factor for flagellar operon FliA